MELPDLARRWMNALTATAYIPLSRAEIEQALLDSLIELPAEPESVAYQEHHHVDLSYVRCLNVLLAGSGHPMIATHDQRLINIATERAYHYRRDYDSFEFQMLLGMRPNARRRLLDAGHHVRVYVPFGTQWYGYMMRRLAERPANLAFFLKSLAKRG